MLKEREAVGPGLFIVLREIWEGVDDEGDVVFVSCCWVLSSVMCFEMSVGDVKETCRVAMTTNMKASLLEGVVGDVFERV